jgi:hypothetical protein
MKITKSNIGLLALAIVLLSLVACNCEPQISGNIAQAPFNRKVDTALYSGDPAIIFRLDDVAKGWNKKTVEQIIRLFGKHNVPLDVGIIPHADGKDSYELPFLKRYLDAGIIDLSIHANKHIDKEFDTSQSGVSYKKLTTELTRAIDQFKQYFGIAPMAFTVPYDFFNEEGYKAVYDAGFKIFSTQKAVEFSPTIYPADYSGNRDKNGMSRLCTVSDVAHWDAENKEWGEILSIGPGTELSQAIDWGLKNLEVAVVGVHPDAFLDKNNNLDPVKLGQLEDIIKSAKELAVITTFKQWYQFAYEVVIGPPHVRKQETPPYHGGPAVIFRMDDADKGFLEDTVEQIIQIFEKNGVPLDVGVMPRSGGRRSYYMPFLLKYLDAGVIDISMHGYLNTFSEFDTELSGATFAELDEELQNCFVDAYGQSTFSPTKSYYTQLNSGLLAARGQFKHYFGVTPIAFTVPYDYFNEEGYKAVQHAGFKIFSSQQLYEPYPNSNETVDYFGKHDDKGMYRLPMATDTAAWNDKECSWGDILELISTDENELYSSISWSLNSQRVGVAVIGVHPQSFIDISNKPDAVKLDKLEKIVKHIIDRPNIYGEIITFQSWYKYTVGKQ